MHCFIMLLDFIERLLLSSFLQIGKLMRSQPVILRDCLQESLLEHWLNGIMVWSLEAFWSRDLRKEIKECWFNYESRVCGVAENASSSGTPFSVDWWRSGQNALFLCSCQLPSFRPKNWTSRAVTLFSPSLDRAVRNFQKCSSLSRC